MDVQRAIITQKKTEIVHSNVMYMIETFHSYLLLNYSLHLL